jgi:hypothetical protein
MEMLSEQDKDDVRSISRKQLTKQVLQLKGSIECSYPTTQLTEFQGTLTVDEESLKNIGLKDKAEGQTQHADEGEFSEISIKEPPSSHDGNQFPLGPKQLLLRVRKHVLRSQYTHFQYNLTMLILIGIQSS